MQINKISIENCEEYKKLNKIKSDINGCPYHSEKFVSISYCQDIMYVSNINIAIGLDVEAVSESNKFLSSKLNKNFTSLDRFEAIDNTIIFSAIESLVKYMRIGICVDLKYFKIDKMTNKYIIFKGFEELITSYYLVGNLVICITSTVFISEIRIVNHMWI